MAEHVCPWWFGYALASPVRRLFLSPEKLLGPYVKPGMNVLEIGPGMGFFTLPMAKLAGPAGKIIAVDIQQKMLDNLQKRARKAGLGEHIQTRLSAPDVPALSDLGGKIDFALLFAVVHEVPDKKNLIEQVFFALKPDSRVLIADPRGHCAESDFEQVVRMAQAMGFARESAPQVRNSHTALLRKTN